MALMSEKVKALRREWEEKVKKNGPNRLKKGTRPVIENNCEFEDKCDNIKKRFRDLAEVVYLLYTIYQRDGHKDLYGDAFLAFVGHYVIRNWPWVDYPFTSVEARNEIEADVTGLLNSDIKNNITKKNLKNIISEHWTPISFFRDLFSLDDKLTKEDFYQSFIMYYRIVRITEPENANLDIENKIYRTEKTYEKLGIEIEENKLWGEFDALLNKD